MQEVSDDELYVSTITPVTTTSSRPMTLKDKLKHIGYEPAASMESRIQEGEATIAKEIATLFSNLVDIIRTEGTINNALNENPTDPSLDTEGTSEDKYNTAGTEAAEPVMNQSRTDADPDVDADADATSQSEPTDSQN